MNTVELQITDCDYSNPDHLKAVVELLNAYIADEMGGGEPLSPVKGLHLVDGLNNHPSSIVLLARVENVFAGMLVGFVNFSTFTVKPMVNIHDLIVRCEYRKKGIARALMDTVIQRAKEKGCSRVTLEVRKDNIAAQCLYKTIGFAETDPEMYYWRKNI
ncbi:MAG: GNAT family N-acetyltransferase [Bacteroidales bacterium]|jgi:ribosomal protein S18 acetylase RimI-like enzyme|nr:GNAT family N-acetyltransferase [Bacteroidales bacterium]